MPAINPYFKKFTLVILALQILNLSIYNTDFYVFDCFCSANSQVKDINPIDSFAELMIEDVGGYQNAFPEPAQKNDKQSGELKHNISFQMFHLDRFVRLPEKAPINIKANDTELSRFCDNYSFLYWKEINHPPA